MTNRRLLGQVAASPHPELKNQKSVPLTYQIPSYQTIQAIYKKKELTKSKILELSRFLFKKDQIKKLLTKIKKTFLQLFRKAINRKLKFSKIQSTRKIRKDNLRDFQLLKIKTPRRQYRMMMVCQLLDHLSRAQKVGRASSIVSYLLWLIEQETSSNQDLALNQLQVNLIARFQKSTKTFQMIKW